MVVRSRDFRTGETVLPRDDDSSAAPAAAAGHRRARSSAHTATASATASSHMRLCEHPGCTQAGEYRAPKSRASLADYYWFCLEHVRAYNRNWDYCAGMSAAEIEAHIRGDTTWQRPTWPMGQWRLREAMLRQAASAGSPFGRAGGGGEAGPSTAEASRVCTPEEAALADLGLTPPVVFADIKARYRELAKRYHPDANGGDPGAEEKLKQINLAYTILKAAWQRFV